MKIHVYNIEEFSLVFILGKHVHHLEKSIFWRVEHSRATVTTRDGFGKYPLACGETVHAFVQNVPSGETRGQVVSRGEDREGGGGEEEEEERNGG